MLRISNLIGPVSSPIEKIIKTQPVILTLIILYQGLFSGNAIKIPQNLKTLFDNGFFRFLSLVLIAFTATNDIEYSMISTMIFITIMYVIKTPEEREETGLI